MQFPIELKEYPVHILEGMRAAETELFPGTLRAWSLVLSGWLMRLAFLQEAARKDYLDSVLVTKGVFATMFHVQRTGGESVSASEKAAEHSAEYLGALSKEYDAEAKFKAFGAYYDATVECLNAIKKSLDTWVQEARMVSGQPT